MGMFDTFHLNGDEYQTKDLRCRLDHLFVVGQRLVRVPLDSDGDGGPSDIFEYGEDLNYHGEIDYYRSNPQTGRSENWKARFVNGNLIATKLIPPRS